MSKICKDFMYNRCNREQCKFLHDSNVCFYFWKNGSCKNNEQCLKTHINTIKVNKGTTNELKQKKKDKYNKNKHKKNTETFEPMTRPVDLRVVCETNPIFNTKLTCRDVLLVPNLFNDFQEGEIYLKLIDEIETCGIDNNMLLKMWHGDSHLIADDHLNWKEKCPTFNMVIERIKTYFNMDIKATRFNWYKDTSQFKPFHFDAAAIKPHKAKTQNITVGVSFGVTRDAAFEHAGTKTVISFPQPDGYIYAFTNDTNIKWRHGILQDLPIRDEGRISIIAWSWIDNVLN